MKNINRVFLIVLDSFGVGELPDAAAYGDEGSSTLASVSRCPELRIPNMMNLGLYHIPEIGLRAPRNIPMGVYGKMAEASAGKDTTTGHWELAGLISHQPMPVFPEGFPQEVLDAFEKATGRGVLCNKPYSGTQVIKDYGPEHMETGKWIVYTSADSVFQIAALVEVIPVTELYEGCEKAREILTGPYGVGRVIARPFLGKTPEDFYRTSRRHDFSLVPGEMVLPRLLQEHGVDTMAVGKIYDIFAGVGFDEPHYTKNNQEGMELTAQMVEKDFHGLCFTNLVDFDSAYGHRNDPAGYAKALTEFDQWLGTFLEQLKEDDILVITADHGCDPASPSTDHSREYVPVLIYNQNLRPGCIGIRNSFADLGKTIAGWFGITDGISGSSFEEDLVWMQEN
ncbi:MAG: phosphopentomutase [Firmicutes bacterium]|nr:phosphopentomutase [Bacillota bacterium]